ncbi:MAG TPA: hypothetical protein VEC38_04480 [Candidatus Binataceae bacterium]|nr:hypothetical protein [Candidatus Binataceae bacterium]
MPHVLIITLRRLAFLSAFVLGALSPIFSQLLLSSAFPSRREIVRVASPDKREDAVLVRARASALSRERHWEVFVVRHQMPIGQSSPVFVATRVADPRLAWPDARLLQIGFGRARVSYFTSAWSPSASGEAAAVEIRLKPAENGFTYLVAGAGPDAIAQPPK